ncbi:hypothetical protein JYG32_33665 [Burkholderia pyrrocinia]|nr:hypothetical protein JYG32_33665 [Burkholderia pyrrocinia]
MAKHHHFIHVHKLRPTQMTVGMREVHDKRKHIESLSEQARREFIETHPIPAVLGPDARHYLIDHHHLGRALSESKIADVLLEVIEDLSDLSPSDFWAEMDASRWVHPFDESGVRRPVDQLPHHVDHLVDDPYRSLAAYVRNQGGYHKNTQPFSEFLWADFFRERILRLTNHHGFGQAVKEAVRLAQTGEAAHLPGFIGNA